MEIVQKSPRSGKVHKVVAADGVPALQTVLGLGAGVASNADLAAAKHIDNLSYSRLEPGCTVLGYILQINSDDSVTVSLPGGLVGRINKSEIADVQFDTGTGRDGGSSSSSSAAGGAGGAAREEEETTEDDDDDAQKAKGAGASSHPLRLQQMVRCVVLPPLGDDNHADARAQKRRKQQHGVRLSMRASLVQRGISFKHHIAVGFPVYGAVYSSEDHGCVGAYCYCYYNYIINALDASSAQPSPKRITNRF